MAPASAATITALKSGIFLKVSSRILAFSARDFAAIVMDDEEEESVSLSFTVLVDEDEE